ncbi:response regulator [Methylomonas koyamae]|uniref:histidine kinase n=1 Tax=Methylomonas koyamae TaxID=702114 RepID=A0A291IGU7_9GAMM|nr:response regulator [Methylomonas koyamae]ATG89595.1 hybrid sensor histidine kinase/response regulator [Methylomonas koyamae]OAI23470.1 hybrid sensor histidine kinase/response regulator [Methylomonas koyamae]
MKPIRQNITKIRRDYNALVANETLEDYALRYAPRSFRKWSEFQVANTAFGSTSFLVLEAIGGFLSINYGFTNAFWAIIAVGIVIFITSLPISYYAAKFHIDIDLLTRAAGFGYIGSTVTSLIYASFTFTLFALEASIMSLALELYFQIPLAYAHVVSAVIVVPLVTFGITTISRMQLWTQPVWLLLLIAPYIAVARAEPEALLTLETYFWIAGSGQGFDWLLFGSAATVACSMVAQIGEQVDFLRFLPDQTEQNKWRWWGAMLAAGPGWVVFGVVRQLLGALLAHLAIRHGIPAEHAHEPTQMYLVAYNELFEDPKWALAATTLFVVLSQLKINVTNAYAGSLAWSNFFSRLTHSHPGRVVWLLFNVLIALLLMEFGVFGALEKVLGLFSNMSIAWISTVAAELMINKPLGLSPKEIEFKRAYLSDLNPVGMVSTFVASLVSILAYVGLFGEWPKAFSALIALGLAFALVPALVWFSQGKHYLARDRDERNRYARNTCSICENEFEHDDVAYCPAYGGSICSLCCTLDARCLDSCKVGFRFDDYLERMAKTAMPEFLSLHARMRLLRFGLLFGFLAVLTGIFISIIYYQDLLSIRRDAAAFQLLLHNFLKIYASLLVFIGLCTWWLILNAESRRVAHEETAKQTQLLLQEIDEHKKTDSKLQQAMKLADSANQAKSRFLSSMSHEIRSPLNSIIGYAHILHQDPEIPPHRKQAVETLKRSGEHLCALVEDILDIARIEARKFELKYQPFNFPDFVEHLVHTYQVQAEDKGLSFKCQIGNHLPQRVRGDEKRVGQILINLLGNAVKFTERGEIVFRIGYSGGVASFQVIDSGAGIDEEHLQNIFQPFTRVNQATGNAVAGAGLGLTISKILTEVMGGELTVKSRPGEGSTFTVRLLLPSLGADTDPEPAAAIVGYAGARRRIMVVDDQREHRELLLEMLEPLGFYLSEADSGEQCLEKSAEDRPDLILLDISMSGMNGIETAMLLRERGCSVPIVILSANAYASDRMAALNAGCNDFLAKPIQVRELMHKLKLYLALEWLYRDEAAPVAASERSVPVPPAELLADCVDCVRIGDLMGLKKVLQHLSVQHPQYAGFFAKLEGLANEFKLGRIRQLLNMTKQEAGR